MAVSKSSAGSKSRLKFLSYNIHKGYGAVGIREILAQVKDLLVRTSADIVCLQEVMGVLRGSDGGFESQFEFLADGFWKHYSYGKNAVYSSGNHGNAILSKYPILWSENVSISTNRLERRGILHAVVDWKRGTQPLHVMSLHLNLLHRGRMQQLERLIQRVREKIPGNDPLLIGGDFNDWNRKMNPSLRKELDLIECGEWLTGRSLCTFPAVKPVLSLDRIYSRGIQPLSIQVLGHGWDGRLSDHAALCAEFRTDPL